jgi:hypothetical protein
MHAILGTILLALAGLSISTPDPAMVKAFGHYERVQLALSNDSLDGVEADAKALAAIEPLGREVRRIALELASATDLKDARTKFGALSETLVPGFLAAGITDVEGYYCPMKKYKWVQHSGTAKNPYFGKSMLTCGQKIPSDKKQ